jgi:hypothetical protein
MKLLFVIISLFATTGFSAQNSSSTTKNSQTSMDYKTNISIDTLPMLIGGVGLSADQQFMDSTTIGLQYKSMAPKDFLDGLLTESETQIRQFGVRSRYFFTDVDSSSGYVGLGIIHTRLDLKSRFVLLSKSEWGYAEEQKTAPEYQLGYQFAGRKFSSGSKLMINTSVVYGSGYKYQASYSSSSSEGTKIETKIMEAVFFELGVGLVF